MDDVRAALSSMPETQRRALVLREWHGVASNEIANDLRLSEPATHALLFRAREVVRNRDVRVRTAVRGPEHRSSARAAPRMGEAAARRCGCEGRGRDDGSERRRRRCRARAALRRWLAEDAGLRTRRRPHQSAAWAGAGRAARDRIGGSQPESIPCASDARTPGAARRFVDARCRGTRRRRRRDFGAPAEAVSRAAAGLAADGRRTGLADPGSADRGTASPAPRRASADRRRAASDRAATASRGRSAASRASAARPLAAVSVALSGDSTSSCARRARAVRPRFGAPSARSAAWSRPRGETHDRR